MTTQGFLATVRHQSGVAIIDIQGDINGLVEQELNAAYTEAARSGSAGILLNFSQVDYINSTGLALIVNLLVQARQTGRRLACFGLNEHYPATFTITRLTDFIKNFADEESALQELAVK